MVKSKNLPRKIEHVFRELIEPEHLEAPDRNYYGHRDILTRSLARYHFITQYVNGRVLEVGSGRGYGLQLYADRGKYCLGVDVSLEFLREARDLLPGRDFIQADGARLPIKPGSIDTLIAFEVIEHIQDDHSFLMDLSNLLCRGGIAAISTPNRLVASGQSLKPLDRFHCREYLASEFHALLCQYFPKVTVYGQFDQSTASAGDRLLDRIGVRWKYLLPAHIQGKLSILIRKPIDLEDCQFEQENLDSAHTFIALCEKQPGL